MDHPEPGIWSVLETSCDKGIQDNFALRTETTVSLPLH